MAEHEEGPDLADADKLDGGLAEIQAKLAGVKQSLGGEGMSEDQIKAMLEQSGVAGMPGMPPMPGMPASGMGGGDGMSAPLPKMPKDPLERVEAAEKKKGEGNDKFKKGEVAAAKADYTEALRLVPAGYGAPKSEQEPDLRERADACRVPVLLNLSLCCLKSEPCEAFKALELCEEVLDTDPDNVKATYRKAKALQEMGELKEAEWEFKRGCKLAPKDVAMRKDFEALRARMKEHRDREKETYAAAFSKGPGFMSQGRGDEGDAASAKPKGAYEFLTDPDENQYRKEEKPREKAVEFERAGRLEDAVQAWEVALSKTEVARLAGQLEAADWLSHFSNWVELARLFMDLNNDTLALRCINKVTEEEAAAGIEAFSTAEGDSMLEMLRVRQHALLLRAICLLNEAEGDMQLEVGGCLQRWLGALGLAKSGDVIDERLSELRAEGGADICVAHGLLLLVRGNGDDALLAFVDALRAPEDEKACFGGMARRATKWNMLGAVLANRQRQEHALAAYEQALVLHPHFPRALNNRGIALVAKADLKSAAGAYARALKVSPEWLAPAFWPHLQKCASDAQDVEGLNEAAQKKNLSGVLEILGVAAGPAEDPEAVAARAPPLEDVLASMGFGKAEAA